MEEEEEDGLDMEEGDVLIEGGVEVGITSITKNLQISWTNKEQQMRCVLFSPLSDLESVCSYELWVISIESKQVSNL